MLAQEEKNKDNSDKLTPPKDPFNQKKRGAKHQ